MMDLPKATAENIKVYDELEAKLNAAAALMDTESDYEKATKNLDDALSEFMNYRNSYDWLDYTFAENGLTGLKDVTGKVLVPPIFEEIEQTYEYFDDVPFTAVMKDGKWGLVKNDGTGTMIIDPIYDYAVYGDRTGFYALEKDGKFALVNKKGEMVVPCMVDKVYEPEVNLSIIESNGKFGIIINHEKLIDPVFDHIEVEYDEPCRVVYQGKSGYLDADGKFTEKKEDAAIGAFDKEEEA